MRMKGTNGRGAAAVEVAILVPVLLLVCIGIVAAWRIWWADAQLQSATAAAARAAAQASTVESGHAAALAILRSDLAASGVVCVNADVLDGSSRFDGLSVSPGDSGTVAVDATCAVALSDLVFPGLPSSMTLRASATEVIDTYGEREP